MLFPNFKKYQKMDGIFDKSLIDLTKLNHFFNLLNNSFIESDEYFRYLSFLKVFKVFKKELVLDGYEIIIKEDLIEIYSSSSSGIYYAFSTILDLLKEDSLACGTILDYPDLGLRGIMLDISRSKVPKLSTLKDLVRSFSRLRINHLELYVEGFSFEYKSYKDEINIDKNYITLSDYLELEAYCNEYFIDLVPNENGFGHMGDWLKLDKFHDLAICPNGFDIWGAFRPGTTVLPSEESIKFVKTLYDDMLPFFKSKYFNMNLDEPLELGLERSKELVEKDGLENVYIDYFLKLYDYVKEYKKTPLMWGDVLIKHPSSIDRLPKDVIFIDWGYDHLYDFNSHSKLLKEKGLNFILAPGTLTWATVVGKNIDMLASISNACIAAKENGGLGVLLTDWGDMGHLQYLPSSYPGFCYGALNMWTTATIDDAINAMEVFSTSKNINKVIYELASFYELEGPYAGYGSRLFSAIMWAEHASRYENKIEFFNKRMSNYLIDSNNIIKLKDFFKEKMDKLDSLDEEKEKEELLNSIYLLNILTLINEKMRKILIDGEIVSFEEEIEKLSIYSNNHLKLWNARNIEAGFILSNKRIVWLQDILALQEKEQK